MRELRANHSIATERCQERAAAYRFTVVLNSLHARAGPCISTCLQGPVRGAFFLTMAGPHEPDLERLSNSSTSTPADGAQRRIATCRPLAALEARIETARATAVVKERIAASQASRREIEKDLAALQSRLSKYQGQLMEVKTNRNIRRCRRRSSRRRTRCPGFEDQCWTACSKADELTAALKKSGGALKAEQAAVAATGQRSKPSVPQPKRAPSAVHRNERL